MQKKELDGIIINLRTSTIWQILGFKWNSLYQSDRQILTDARYIIAARSYWFWGFCRAWRVGYYRKKIAKDMVDLSGLKMKSRFLLSPQKLLWRFPINSLRLSLLKRFAWYMMKQRLVMIRKRLFHIRPSFHDALEFIKPGKTEIELLTSLISVCVN